MRVFVVGAGGQVGAELARITAAAGDAVHKFSRAELDIRDGARVRELVRTHAPDVVFNAAAYTAVDRAEQEPDLAREINALAAQRLAQTCRDLGVQLVHFSTDYVFDGSATAPIPEEAPTAPLSVYGRTKLEGEGAVLRSGADAFVVRSSWLYGLEGANFVKTVLRVTRERGEMRVVNDQRGSPTWARDLAVASRRLVEVGSPGIYHLTNSGDCSWYELACAAVSIAGIPARVEAITTADYPTPAQRPQYSVLSNSRWLGLGEPPLRPWTAALEAFMAELQAHTE